MASLEPDKIRSFTLLGASGCGKSSLTEAILYRTDILHTVGANSQEGRFLDTDPEEKKRGLTLSSKIQTISWDKHRLHFADTPGLPDFIGEAISPLAALDAAVLVIDATSGVDVATKQLFHLAEAYKKPILFFINKMDKENADFDKTVESIRNNLSKHAHPVALPIGAESNFSGVLDLIDSRAFVYKDGKASAGEIPDSEKERFIQAQKHLIEEVAETDEVLFDKLAEGEELKKDDILPRLIQDIEEEEIIPILVGSSTPPMGSELLLDTLTHLILPPPALPEPQAKELKEDKEISLKVHPFEQTVVQAFKLIHDPGIGDLFFLKVVTGSLKPGRDLVNTIGTNRERIGHLVQFVGKESIETQEAMPGDVVAVAKLKNTEVGHTLCSADRLVKLPLIHFPKPVFSLTLLPKTRKDQDKLGAALGKISSGDPTLHYSIDPEFNETILSGMGEVHLEVAANRLREKYGVELELGQPHVAYRETLTKGVEAQGKYKKQTGGHGQFGDVWIKTEPLPLGSGFEFVNHIKGGVIPSKYVPSVETGIVNAMKKGFLAGYPVVDVRVTLYDGSFHSVDSSDLAFQIAGSLGFKKCEEQAKTTLLEPIVKVEVTIPAEFVGSITNDLNSRRGKIAALKQEGDLHVVQADVPMAEMFKYATDLRSLTHGAGRHQMEFLRYEPVPGHLVRKIVEESKREREKK